MKKKNEQAFPADEPDLIEQAIHHKVEKIQPSPTFINRLAARLQRQHQSQQVKTQRRFPIWGYAAAIAAVMITVFVARILWPGSVIPAQPTDIVASTSTPGMPPTVRPTDSPLPTSTEAPTPEPEPSFAADLPPALVSSIPRPGEEVNTKAGILLRFTQPMDKQSVERSLKVKPEVEGTFVWEDDQTVTFHPKALASGMRYQVSVGVDAVAVNGKALTSELVFDFSTIGPLAVSYVSPVAATSAVRSDTPMLVTFNYPVVPINCTGQVADQDGACGTLPLDIVPAITGQGMWVNTSVYRFDPLPGWEAGVSYQVSVPEGFQSVAGAELPEAFTWTFKTALPRVVEVTPVNRATNIPLDGGVIVRFNTPMATGITEEAFRLQDAQGNAINGDFTWGQDNVTLFFTPTQQLALESTYNIRIDINAQSINGAELSQARVSTFTTAPPPSVRRMGGSQNANSRIIEYFEPVRVEFYGLIDAETVPDHIKVTDAGEPVDANVWWNEYEGIPTAYVTWDKTPGAEYCVTVLAGIVDLYGNTINEETTSCFIGGDLPSLFAPATHMDAITLDAAEPAIMYFTGVNVDNVAFTLQRLTDADFVTYGNPLGELLRSWVHTLEGARNEFQVLPISVLAENQPLPTGLYQLTWEANTDRWGQQRLRIAVVDRHLTLKMAADEVLVWVTDLRTAVPIAGAQVRLLSHTGVELGSGVTDADGIARFPIPPQPERWDTFLAITGTPGEAGFGAARSDWDRDVGSWSFDIPSDYGQPPAYKTYVHTDRPIYRPGQMMTFRGILRADDDAIYSLPPEGTQVNLSLYDAYYDLVDEWTLETSATGIFDGAYALPADGNLGAYSLNIEVPEHPDSGTSIQFTVAAYRKPEFEVAVSPEFPELLNGEEARVLAEAVYYAGGAVSNNRLHWKVSAEPHVFDPDIPGWWQWGYDPYAWEWWREPEVLAEGDATTDANGQFLWTRNVMLEPLGNQEKAGPQQWQLEVTVTDEAGFPVTGRQTWVVHPAAYYLGLKPRSWIAYAGAPADVDLMALDWEAMPVASQSVRVQLAKRTWEFIPATEPYTSPKWEYTDEIEETLTVTTDNAGKAVASVTPSESGSYVVIAESADQQGNPVRSETYLWVAGKERAVWQQPENQVKPIADANSYQPGDVARILLPTSFAAPYEVLMTVERAGILSIERIAADVSNPVIEVPIREDYVPNVIVSFVAVKGVDAGHTTPDVRVGMVNLPVDAAEKMLTVEVTPLCQQVAAEGVCTYEPGENALLEVFTKDSDGVPVSADVAVAVVDKAVLALADPNSLTLQEAFYAERPLRVFTGDGLVVLFNRSLANLERLEQQASTIAKEMLYGGIGGGGGGAAYQADVREDFPDTALWEARLRTDSEGKGQVRFQLPDSLTTWVVDARAITDASQVGQGTVEFMVTKPLLVRPVTPRFFTAGDQSEVAAVVHNNTGTDMIVEVGLQVEGIDLAEGSPAEQRVNIRAYERARVVWQIRVPVYGAEEASLVFTAEGNGYRDAARPSVGNENSHALPILRYASPEVYSTSGQLATAGTRLEAIVIPPEASPDSTLTVRLDPTLAAGMLDGLSYLEVFPHACTEQLISRFLPNVVSYLALKELGYQDDELETKLWALIAETLDMLYSRQLADGGWGWWSESSNFQVSAYAALGMLQAQRTGFTVEWDALNAVVDYLVRTLDFGLRSEKYVSPQAFALYVLSEGGYDWPSGADDRLFEARELLGLSGKAFLALALGIKNPEDARIQTLLEELRADAEITASGAHWEGETGVYWQTWTRTTAIVLDAFARLAPDDPLIPQAVRWLMVARKADRWETTQETAWAVIGLTDALVATGELKANYEWGVALNQEALAQGEITSETLRQPVELSRSVAELLREWPNALEISRGEGEGVLYYTADLKVYLPVEDLRAESRGISIERQYCVYAPESERSTIPGDDFQPCVPLTSAKPGDLVEVRLTLTLPKIRNYLVLEDPYPAGMEPVDPSLKTESELLLEPEAQIVGEDMWWRPSFDHSELRDEKAVFYASQLTAGTYQARYLLRASLPGIYKVIPATVNEMYFPGVFGRSEGMVFTVSP